MAMTGCCPFIDPRFVIFIGGKSFSAVNNCSKQFQGIHFKLTSAVTQENYCSILVKWLTHFIGSWVLLYC